ncbi:unnamed protein product [Peronospora belbahrii]|uniref:ELMO domain-containing protein n=1 Tax=Peronospora belbahrii TaxID=622444 RepID=A0AAU9KN24_9STRA|nr:unnamed protein product [Peronospora belbahrii]
MKILPFAHLTIYRDIYGFAMILGMLLTGRQRATAMNTMRCRTLSPEKAEETMMWTRTCDCYAISLVLSGRAGNGYFLTASAITRILPHQRRWGKSIHSDGRRASSFDPTLPEDDDMLQHLWSGLFPMLPYEGRVNARWRDVGFQNDDPVSDLRTSGRLAIRMLLYFSDHVNDEFKRMLRENCFPVCVCALNLLEMLLCHLKLKEPLPLVCPCCGTENAELETSAQPSRAHPELCGFTALIVDASSLASAAFSHRSAEGGPAEVALAHIFAHSLLVMDAVWKQRLQQNPAMTLMHFREALVETRARIVVFLSRRRIPLTLEELNVWGYRQRERCRSFCKKR